MVYCYPCETDEWQAFLVAMKSGEEVEINEEMYDYWLGVLPPVMGPQDLPFPDPKHPMKYDFGFAEGRERITLFYSNLVRSRFFCRRSPYMNPYA